VGQFEYPQFYSNLASLCDNVSIGLDSAEARIQESVEQIANEPDSNKIVLLARELSVLLQPRNARRDTANKETPKEMWVDYHRFIAVMDPPSVVEARVTAGMLFLVSALQLLRNSRAAFPVFAVAWVLGAIGNWISQSCRSIGGFFICCSNVHARPHSCRSESIRPWRAYGQCSLAKNLSGY
jgi:hypothetical protein